MLSAKFWGETWVHREKHSTLIFKTKITSLFRISSEVILCRFSSSDTRTLISLLSISINNKQAFMILNLPSCFRGTESPSCFRGIESPILFLSCVNKRNFFSKFVIPSDFLEGFPETIQMFPEIFLNTKQFHKQQATHKKIQKPTKDINMPKQNKTTSKKSFKI